MTILPDLLRSRDITNVLVIDDVYDQWPRSNDLKLEAEEWPSFFDDINASEKEILEEAYPGYSSLEAPGSSDDFVEALWQVRNRMRQEITNPLFERYIEDVKAEKAHLQKLINQLEVLGLTVDTAGREFREKAKHAQLILIDLFLGGDQDGASLHVSMDGLLDVIRKKADHPPVVILMSRSSRLDDKRREFRDRSGLFESTFGVIKKAELDDERKLSRLLHLLVSHYDDSLKLIAFVTAWETGIAQAGRESSRLIKGLDLADHANIKHLLLKEEGAPTGGYLVDVFDRILQHHVEANVAIIEAAMALNDLSGTYPPPQGADFVDPQGLMYQSLFQHPNRLQLKGSLTSPFAFGDLLKCKQLTTTAATAQGGVPATFRWPYGEVDTNDVIAILTQACDLQRIDPTGSGKVLLLHGKLKALARRDYPTDGSSLRTPVIEVAGGNRFSIIWDPKHFETVRISDMVAVLNSGELEVIARLRETHALELQQHLLSRMGRVGQIAPMPSNYMVGVEAFYPDSKSKLVKFDTASLTDGRAYCYRGREINKSDSRLVLGFELCCALCKAVQTLDITKVNSMAAGAVEFLHRGEDLWEALIRGIPVPASRTCMQSIVSPISFDEQGSPKKIGYITCDSTKGEGQPFKGVDIASAGILLVVRITEDTDPDSAASSVH